MTECLVLLTLPTPTDRGSAQPRAFLGLCSRFSTVRIYQQHEPVRPPWYLFLVALTWCLCMMPFIPSTPRVGHVARLQSHGDQQPGVNSLSSPLLLVVSLVISIGAAAAAAPFWDFIILSGTGFFPETQDQVRRRSMYCSIFPSAVKYSLGVRLQRPLHHQ